MSEAYDWIISENVGSDTDTNACIAGALLGAHIGFDNFDEATLENYQKNDRCTRKYQET